MRVFRQAAGIIFTVIALSVAPAAAAPVDDVRLCDNLNTPPNQKIAACTRVIAAGRHRGKDLSFAYQHRGVAYERLENWDRAFPEFQQAARLDPSIHHPHHGMGNVHLARGEYDLAIAAFTQAIRINPKVQPLWYLRAQAWRNKGDYDRAIDDYSESIRLEPKGVEAYYYRAYAWYGKNDLDRAIADFTQAVRLDADYYDAYVGRGDALNDKQDYDRAIADFDQAIRIDAKASSAYVGRAFSYIYKKDLARALADAEESLRADPNSIHSVNVRGVVYFHKNDHARALADFDAAVRIDPKVPAPHANRCETLVTLGRNTEALAACDEALRLDPKYFLAHAFRGTALETLGRKQDALENYFKALADTSTSEYNQGVKAKARERIAALTSGGGTPSVTPAASDPRPPAIAALAPPADTAAPRTGAAEQGRRIAFVIGNDKYENIEKLQKAVNDARAMSAALNNLGFEVVRIEDGTRRAINQALADFTGKVSRGDTAFFFYAGHGIEIRGLNYLLPIDVPPAREGQEGLIAGEAIAADTIIERLQERGARVAMMVIDACRENPFRKAGTRNLGGSRGLGQMSAPEGVFVLFSAGFGQSALDRLSDDDPHPNSVFTRTFLEQLGKPGVSMQDVAKATQSGVRRLAATLNHAQMPAYYDQIDGALVLSPR